MTSEDRNDKRDRLKKLCNELRFNANHGLYVTKVSADLQHAAADAIEELQSAPSAGAPRVRLDELPRFKWFNTGMFSSPSGDFLQLRDVERLTASSAGAPIPGLAGQDCDNDRPGRIPELEPARRNAAYWERAARNEPERESALQHLHQAMLAWKNAAYAVADGTLRIASSGAPSGAHPEDFCQECGRPNIVWFTPSELWNKGVRAVSAPEILCPVCFVKHAEAAGIEPTTWKVAPEQHERVVPMQPTYYVRHPDDSYSVADPQPVRPNAGGETCCGETPCQWGDHPCGRKRPIASHAREIPPPPPARDDIFQLAEEMAMTAEGVPGMNLALSRPRIARVCRALLATRSSFPQDVLEKAGEFKGRADDAGFLARAILSATSARPE